MTQPLSLIQHFSAYVPVSEALAREITTRIKPRHFKKGELVLDADTVCTKSWFVVSGLLRGYFVKDGREVSEYFSAEGEWTNSPRSFMQRRPDIYYLDALEPTDAYILHINDLGYLFDTFPEMERYARLTMGTLFGHFLERISSMRFTTAKEKYDHFCQTYAGVHHRIPLGMIASYLGIAPETLSRIRASR